MTDINVAVIGAAKVGKSTFIQKALGLRTLPTAPVASLKMKVDSNLYTTNMIELDLEHFDVDLGTERIKWPVQINGQIVPRIDGVLLLYDVMTRDSIAQLPQTLSE